MFALCSNFTKAFVIFFARSSKLPAQPTQNSTSGCLPWAIYSAIVGTFSGSFIFLKFHVPTFCLFLRLKIIFLVRCASIFIFPIQAVHLVVWPRGAVVFIICHSNIQFGGGCGLFHNQVLAKFHYYAQWVYTNRTDLNAGIAGGAGP